MRFGFPILGAITGSSDGVQHTDVALSAVSTVEKIARENTNRMAYESRFKETTRFATELMIVSAFVVFPFDSLWNLRDIGRFQDVL